jgi:predicted nucleotidyltransferase
VVDDIPVLTVVDAMRLDMLMDTAAPLIEAQLKIAEKAGVHVFGPVVNTNTRRSTPWNLARAVTFVKAVSEEATSPVHPNVGMGLRLRPPDFVAFGTDGGALHRQVPVFPVPTRGRRTRRGMRQCSRCASADVQSGGKATSAGGASTVSLHLEFDQETLTRLCERNKIRRLSFFGSVLRDDFGPESDVDVLVEFAPTANVGLFEFVDLQLELSRTLGREVDLHTPASLSHFFRERVLDSAEVAYAA